MREYITPDRIANQLRMLRGDPRWAFVSFLMIEGYTDERIYERFVDDGKCQIIVAHNKDNAKKALFLLEKDRFAGVLAIVDADFDVLEGKLPTSQNLLFTDAHDLEAMLIQSPALEKILAEFGSKEKIAEFVRRSGKEIRVVLIECGVHIGYLRWISLRDGLSLKFEELDFGKFLDKEKFFVEEAKLIKTVKDKSQRHDLTDTHLKSKVSALRSDVHDHWHTCCGHDLVCALSIGLCKAIGSCNPSEVKPDALERSLRLAYEYSYFSRTHLYASIREWEKRNTPYVVLKAE